MEIYSVGEDYEPSRYALDGVVVNLGVFSDMNRLAEIYRDADIGVAFISTPTYTYQHLEYMASGLGLIANNQPGVSDFLKDGENAVLCPAFPSLAAAKIVELINNPDKLEKISKAGLATVQEFTWENVLTASAITLPSLNPDLFDCFCQTRSVVGFNGNAEQRARAFGRYQSAARITAV